MARAISFGVGLTIVLIGLAVWIHSLYPGDDTPVAMLIGSVLICPGAILLGRAFWPPGDKKN